MELPNNTPTFLAVIAKLPQQKIAQAISVVLLAYIAFIAAKVTWLLVPNSVPTIHLSINKHTNANGQQGQQYDINALQALNLFGIYDEAPKEQMVVEVKDAPETRLSLTLSGLVASDTVDTAAAIIEHQGKQETYGIGDVIRGTRASLERVLMDRVLIKHSGRMETLMLDGFDYNQPAKALTLQKSQAKESPKSKKNNRMLPRSPNIVDQRKNTMLSSSALNLRNDISKDPSKIIDYLRIQPYRQKGSLIGYRLMPGKNAKFFKQSGLRTGDIAVQMNGYDLTAASEAAQALSELRKASEVSLLIKRKDELIEILFSVK